MGEQGKAPVFGLMQDWPLTVDRFIEHARCWHGTREIVSRHADGSMHRDTYTTLSRSRGSAPSATRSIRACSMSS